MADDVTLGKLPDSNSGRDAIHIAVAPVVAAGELRPGAHVGLLPDGTAVDGIEAIGIVDPFLKHPVKLGERFWLCLYPKTITSLRHEWSHPAFAGRQSDKAASERWMEEFAAKHFSHQDEWYRGTGSHYTAQEVVDYAKDFLLSGDKHVQQGSESLRDSLYEPGLLAEFWKHFEVLTGMKVADYHLDQVPFCCTC